MANDLDRLSAKALGQRIAASAEAGETPIRLDKALSSARARHRAPRPPSRPRSAPQSTAFALSYPCGPCCPDNAAVLAPLIIRELHYRLLIVTGGHVLRMLLRRESHASNIARAIRLLREDYRRRVEMSELAQAVGMSASSFYKHFKAVTQTAPLQYQKDLRLTEARRLVLGGAHSVSSAAHAVGRARRRL